MAGGTPEVEGGDEEEERAEEEDCEEGGGGPGLEFEDSVYILFSKRLVYVHR